MQWESADAGLAVDGQLGAITMGDGTMELLGGYLPRFLGAIAILIVGWIVALVASRFVRTALGDTGATRKVAGWLSDEDSVDVDKINGWCGRAVFILLMLFVLVAFFQVLGLSSISEPITKFLNEVFEYAPRLIGPAILIVAAWLSATLLRFAVKRGLKAGKLDERVGSGAGLDKAEQMPLSDTLGDTAYWLTLLLFLPAVLGALNLGGLLAPVQGMIDEILGFLPNLLAAAVIVFVGWLVAKILQRVVVNLMVAAGADGLSDRVGLSTALGATRLSSLVGLIVYVLTLVPVLVAGLNALQLDAITGPASGMLNAILSAIPAIFAAVLVLGLAYIVGRIVAGLTTNVLAAAGFNSILSRLGVGDDPKPGERSPSELAGYLVIVAIMLFATIEALGLLGFDALRTLVAEFLVFAGQVFLGLVIFGVGLYLSSVAVKAIHSSKAKQADVLAVVTRVAILVLAAAIGLRQMGLANEIITIGFACLFGAVAVAAAIAFGIGGKNVASELIEGWSKEFKKPASKK